jgi:hypothetical protein
MRRQALFLTIFALFGLGLLTNFAAAQQPVPTETPTPFPTFTLQFTPAPTIPPTVGPTPTPGCAAPLPLVRGATAFVNGGVYVRYAASVSSPWVNYYQSSVTVRIVDGPVCNNNYNWWAVKGPGNDGWVAEGRPGDYWIRLAELPGPKCSSPAQLAVGKRAVNFRDLRVHDQPSDAALVLTVAPQNSTLDILEGPTCAEDYNWWRVRVTVVGVAYTGWVADGSTKGTLWMQDADATPPPVCAPPLELGIGSRGYVNYKGNSPKNLRAEPDEHAELIATLIDGIGFQVVDGPVCGLDGLNWWKVQILSRPDVVGWLAEGGPQNYWIQTLNTIP